MRPVPRLGYLSAGPRVSTHPSAEARGPRSHVLGVISGFRSMGWEVTPYIVGDRVPSALRNSERRLVGRRVNALMADLARLAFRPWVARSAWRQLRGQVDWVYERLASFQAMGMPFRRAGIPWILETNALLYEEAAVERRTVVLAECARRLEFAAYRKCDVLVSISETLKDLIVRKAGISADKVLAIPNGVDTEFFDAARHPPRRLFSGFAVVYAGSLAAWQGLDLFLYAMASARKKHLPVQLVIGGDGPIRDELEQLVRKLELTESVRFLGKVPQDQVPELIAGGDIAYSGHFDLGGGPVFRSPLKLYEYMAMGKPVLGSAVGDAKVLIGNDRHGFLFTPGDTNDLERALLKAYSARERLGEMGIAAREEIVRHHSWSARTRSIANGAEQILGSSGR
jgi:glycosyltransferase involved in cell wall biosynthesis